MDHSIPSRGEGKQKPSTLPFWEGGEEHAPWNARGMNLWMELVRVTHNALDLHLRWEKWHPGALFGQWVEQWWCAENRHFRCNRLLWNSLLDHVSMSSQWLHQEHGVGITLAWLSTFLADTRWALHQSLELAKIWPSRNPWPPAKLCHGAVKMLLQTLKMHALAWRECYPDCTCLMLCQDNNFGQLLYSIDSYES